MQPIIRPLPADPDHRSMAEREKAHFLALDEQNRHTRRREKLKALRDALPF